MWILNNAEKVAAFLALAGAAWGFLHIVFRWANQKIVTPIVSVKTNLWDDLGGYQPPQDRLARRWTPVLAR